MVSAVRMHAIFPHWFLGLFTFVHNAMNVIYRLFMMWWHTFLTRFPRTSNGQCERKKNDSKITTKRKKGTSDISLFGSTSVFVGSSLAYIFYAPLSLTTESYWINIVHCTPFYGTWCLLVCTLCMVWWRFFVFISGVCIVDYKANKHKSTEKQNSTMASHIKA